MLVRGASSEDIINAATTAGVRLTGGGPWGAVWRDAVPRPVPGRLPSFRFTLRTLPRENRKDPIRFGRYGFSRNRSTGNRRRVPGAVCWHGHRNFMRELFRLAPGAVLVSAFATYKGRDDFERNHGDTAYREVGSRMEPVSFADLCDCDDE